MSLDKTIAEYESRLTMLRDWPDGAIIHELTTFAVRNDHIANHIADILVSRIIDPSTNPAFKVPLFYLIDSVMKAAGALYAPLFASHIAVVFQRTFAELIDIDKARLDYLLSTWEERVLLPPNLLHEMRSAIGTRIVVEKLQAMPPQQHMPREPPPMGRRPPPFDPSRGGPPPLQQPPRDRRGPPPPPMPAQLNPQLRDIMEEELNQVRSVEKRCGHFPPNNHCLAKFYISMKATDRLLLQDLCVVNPMLYAQIHSNASDKLSAMGGGRNGGDGMGGASLNKRNVVNAFICEQSVPLDLDTATELSTRLNEWESSSFSDPLLSSLRQPSAHMAARLKLLLPCVIDFPPLPAVVTDTLPEALVKQREAEMLKSEPKIKIPIPKFRIELLSKPPKDALNALYSDRPFFCRQDGSRFKSQAELGAHLDTLFSKNEYKQQIEKQQREGKKTNRQWYCREAQWVTDFGSLRLSEGEGDAVGQVGSVGVSYASVGTTESDSNDLEMVVPADEHFTRCPVSHESFLPEWDPEEGDYMYRNAVKVLVTEETDPDLYGDAQETSHEQIRYAIVNQKLVMEGWLSSGKAASLRDALVKASAQLGGESSAAYIRLRDAFTAAAEEEDPEDVFVRLGSNGEVKELALTKASAEEDEESEMVEGGVAETKD